MPPNVVIVVIDALRADKVGPTTSRDLSPNIDQLIEESVFFDNAFSPSNTTDPAITSILTGKYPLSHGVVNHGRLVTEQEKQRIESVPNLPTALSEAGYNTGKFGRPLGRWHRSGFDVYPSFGSDDAFASPTKRKLSNALESVHPAVRDAASTTLSKATSLASLLPDTSSGTSTDADGPDSTLHNFTDFVSDSEPFFAFVHLMDTHSPYDADPSLVASYLDRYDYDVTVVRDIEGKIPDSFYDYLQSGEHSHLADQYFYSEDEPSSAVIDAHYDATVTEADTRVGEMVSHLRDRDLFDETVFVLLSDHGESLTEHGIYYDHHGLYDESVRIPLVVRPPGGSQGRVTQHVQTIDIVPTITSYLDLSGIECDGIDLRPVIEDGESIDREFLMAEEAHTQRKRMVRSETAKLIYSLDEDTICRYCDVQHARPVELYDLKSDPDEQTNISADRPDQVDELRSYGEQKAREFERQRPAGGSERAEMEYDEEEELYSRLEELGYR